MMLRLSVLTSGGGLRQAATVQSSYALTVGETRGVIYDRNLKPLVNQTNRSVAAVTPTPEAAAALEAALPKEEFLQLMPLLESGKPVLLATSRPVTGSGINSYLLPVRYRSDSLAHHVLGYLDGSGAGVTGVEAGYQALLAEGGGRVRLRYNINAMGAALGSAPAEVSDTRPQAAGGVVLTLDRDIQRLAEQAAAPLHRGAVVVMDVATGELLAMVSRPDFDPNNVAASLNSPGSPLFNRATAAYNVGSTFKLSMVAAALETGYTTDYSYVCPGYYQLGEQRYYCHQRAGHWELAMERAVGQSCNPYFINLGQHLGAARVVTMASSLGFGHAATLAEGVTTVAGSLPDDPSLITDGELANLSFGQGTLTATPVQITQMVAIIAGGGGFLSPTLCRGITTDGFVTVPQPTTPASRVMSAKTAATLRGLMTFVVESGSGKNARPTYGGAGGKTGSAQTGLYHGDAEIVHGWFTGFYPAEAPRYAITVLEEGGGDGGALPARVFAEICNAITLQNDHKLRQITK